MAKFAPFDAADYLDDEETESMPKLVELREAVSRS